MMGHEGEQTEHRALSRRAVKDERKAGDDYLLQFRPAVWKMQPLKVKRIRSFIKEVRMKPWGKKYNLFCEKRGVEERRSYLENNTLSKKVGVFFNNNFHSLYTLLICHWSKQHILFKGFIEHFIYLRLFWQKTSGHVLHKHCTT